jgi:hypothetical protein
MKTLLTTILSLLCIHCCGQTKHQKLIVAEFRIDTPRAGNFTYLVSYKFEDGILKSKDTIFGAETFKKNRDSSFTRYVRFEFGGNFIYKARYVISGTGNVIDIEKKRLVIEEGDDFVSAQGDTIIFHRANIFTGTGFLLLDLKTGKYDFINKDELDKDKEKRSSPDKKHYLSIDMAKIPYKICLHSSTGIKKTIVFDAGHGSNITSGSQRPTIETNWINNHSFLYAVHKTGNLDSSRVDTTSQFNSKYLSKITIREFDIYTKSDRIFMEFDNVKQGDVNGRFFQDKIGQTIYRTSGFKYYLLDTVEKTFVNYDFYELGNNFSVENGPNADGSIIRYHKENIGNMSPSRKVVGSGIIAVERGEDKIAIWSDKTKVWSYIKIPWISSLVGWIDEE